MKKSLFYLSLLSWSLGSTLGFTHDHEAAFTQNNPPHQNEVKRDHHVIFTGDILWGKVEFPQGSSTQGRPGVTEFWCVQLGIQGGLDRLVNNRSKLGFSASIGVALNRTFNLAFGWRYLRSGGRSSMDYTNNGNVAVSFLFSPIINAINVVPNNRIDATNNFRNRLHVLDLVIQTSHWMTSKLRFQPFGGVRYLSQRVRQNINVDLDMALNTFTNFYSSEHYTNTKIGVIFGTDVKYVITKNLFFFSTILTQIAVDIARRTTQNGINIAGTSVSNRFDDANLNANQAWEEKFGFAWETVFGDDWLLSLRIFIELQEDLFQAYGFGFTVLF